MKPKDTDTETQKDHSTLNTLSEPLQTAIIQVTYLREQLELKETEILEYMKKNPTK